MSDEYCQFYIYIGEQCKLILLTLSLVWYTKYAQTMLEYPLTQTCHHSFWMMCPLQEAAIAVQVQNQSLLLFWILSVSGLRSTRVHWGFFFGGGAEWLNSELAGVVPRYLPSDRKRTAGWIKAFILIDEPCAILQNLVDKTTRLKRWIQQSTCCYFSITWVKPSLNACELSLRAHFLFKKIQNRNMRIV